MEGDVKFMKHFKGRRKLYKFGNLCIRSTVEFRFISMRRLDVWSTGRQIRSNDNMKSAASLIVASGATKRNVYHGSR
jgi:hypothetical protein